MPKHRANRVVERAVEIVKLLKQSEGKSLTTGDIMRVLNYSHNQVFYVLRKLQQIGVVREVKVGRIARWKLIDDSEDIEEKVRTLLSQRS